MPDALLIRADGGIRTGTGHVMRCLALAQEWQRTGGTVYFVHAESTPALDARLKEEGFHLRKVNVPAGSADDADATILLAKDYGVGFVVLDGYQFRTPYQSRIKAANLRFLVLDDYGHTTSYEADFILNQNITADALLYKNRAKNTRLLLGTHFALLRKEFSQWRDWKRMVTANPRNVLVTLGGSDPDNVTSRVIDALSSWPQLQVTVVIGGSNPHGAKLERKIAESNSPQIRLETDALDFPKLLAEADVAINAAGTTALEVAFMRLPSVVLILADNQQAIGRRLVEEGLALLGQPEALHEPFETVMESFARRGQMSQKGGALVDGLGARRVVSHLRASDLQCRRVEESDCQLIWEWANEPSTRASSFSSEPIPWEDHVAWFHERRRDPSTLFYLARNGEDKPIGQIRFKIAGDEAVVSVGLGNSSRGRGLGSALLLRGMDSFFSDSQVETVHAFIKEVNKPSLVAFKTAGFAPAAPLEMNGEAAAHFIFRRSEL